MVSADGECTALLVSCNEKLGDGHGTGFMSEKRLNGVDPAIEKTANGTRGKVIRSTHEQPFKSHKDATIKERSHQHNETETLTIDRLLDRNGVCRTWTPDQEFVIRRVLALLERQQQQSRLPVSTGSSQSTNSVPFASAKPTRFWTEWHFALGFLDTTILTVVWARYPQHFWLLWLLHVVLLMPYKWYKDWNAFPRNQILYNVEYCWFSNIVLVLSVAAISPIGAYLAVPNILRKHAFLITFGMGCGTLLGATLALPFVALIFHDVGSMTTVLVHLVPCFLSYTIQWHHDAIQQAYPDFWSLDAIQFFPTENSATAATPSILSTWWNSFTFVPGTGLGTVAGDSLALYMIWLLPYLAWICTRGLHLPKCTGARSTLPPSHQSNRIVNQHSSVDGGKRDGERAPLILPRVNDKCTIDVDKTNLAPVDRTYDTAFHSTCRNTPWLLILLNQLVWRIPPSETRRKIDHEDYNLRDVTSVMLLHVAASWAIHVTAAYLCFSHASLHAAFLMFLFALVVLRGSKHYSTLCCSTHHDHPAHGTGCLSPYSANQEQITALTTLLRNEYRHAVEDCHGSCLESSNGNDPMNGSYFDVLTTNSMKRRTATITSTSSSSSSESSSSSVTPSSSSTAAARSFLSHENKCK